MLGSRMFGGIIGFGGGNGLHPLQEEDTLDLLLLVYAAAVFRVGESHHLKQPCWQPLPLFRRKEKSHCLKLPRAWCFTVAVCTSQPSHCNEAPEAFNLFWLKVLHIPLQVQVLHYCGPLRGPYTMAGVPNRAHRSCL